jgi:hypothetical protein
MYGGVERPIILYFYWKIQVRYFRSRMPAIKAAISSLAPSSSRRTREDPAVNYRSEGPEVVDI